MLLSAEATSSSTFSGFDIIVLLFTLILVFAMYRLLRTQQKNWFAILFCIASLGLFLFMDYHMIINW